MIQFLVEQMATGSGWTNPPDDNGSEKTYPQRSTGVRTAYPPTVGLPRVQTESSNTADSRRLPPLHHTLSAPPVTSTVSPSFFAARTAESAVGSRFAARSHSLHDISQPNKRPRLDEPDESNKVHSELPAPSRWPDPLHTSGPKEPQAEVPRVLPHAPPLPGSGGSSLQPWSSSDYSNKRPSIAESQGRGCCEPRCNGAGCSQRRGFLQEIVTELLWLDYFMQNALPGSTTSSNQLMSMRLERIVP
ncbi:hypothetical protein BDY21DRAFT_85658 [Lineolata rhizophorae]|uniref:Uncharacterized protein n=1 Tax=Lineolata rhizophorae TaxID=578093 RepID=A0A6A6PBQ3_9PEZI|nr:hypothetical protein BDY21DRAFT_85658 [Lineolata rhizophorae]